jgi:DNA-binding LacI/PurR family transcriptional regulator
VSPTTVSFVLNNKKSDIKISRKTRDKVLKIVKELNYKPHILARGLKSGKSTFIGVVFSHIWRENEAKLFEGIENYLSKNGYGIIFKTTGLSFEKEKEAIEFLLEKRVDGLIIQFPLHFDERVKKYIFNLEKKGIKMVIIGSVNNCRESIDVTFSFKGINITGKALEMLEYYYVDIIDNKLKDHFGPFDVRAYLIKEK